MPFVATAGFEPRGISFENIPRNYGLRETNSVEAIVHHCGSIDNLSSLLQSWLFFGLLAAFLNTEINQSDFVDGAVIKLDNDAVHEYFRNWRAAMSRLSPTRRRLKEQQIRARLSQAASQADIFEDAADCFKPDDNFDRVSLSIRLLVCVLSATLDDTIALLSPRPSQFWAPWTSGLASCLPRVLPGTSRLKSYEMPEEYLSDNLAMTDNEEAKRRLHFQPNKFRPFPPGVEIGGRAAGLLMKIFVENGWCSYRALEMCRTYDYLILNSIASMVHESLPGENHRHCLRSQRCIGHDLATDGSVKYPFQHCIEGLHDCAFVEVPRDQITNIIMSDRIPLISLSLEGDLDLKVVKCTPWTTYTAISHVWSDGLGNPKSNALYLCQLLRLRSVIFQTYFAEHSPFFDDSTPASRIASTASWEFWRATSASKPHFKIDSKRVYLWMDTLCIPVSADPETAADRELKFRAMKHITPIFAGAFTTLVLDTGLHKLELPNPAGMSGDEFAAIILGSKWMLRGWTLEEGVLSSTCTFQIADKSYEMSGSLNHSLPKPNKKDSPLLRTSINIRRMLPLVLRRGLLDEKKRLSQDPLVSRAMRITNLLRVPQFVWTWNFLLQRSVTKKQDGPIILANLIDFNVSGLKYVPEAERLMLLIQNCEELPLSLMYNTGPRMAIKRLPSAGWIPQSISGDHIVSGASLRRSRTKGTDGVITYFIDREASDPESFLVIDTGPGRCIPSNEDTLMIRTRVRGQDDVAQEYIIELKWSSPDEDAGDDNRINTKPRIRQQSQGTCFAVDLACGTTSSAGFLGRGVLFGVESYRSGQMLLRYEAPLIVWSLEQWSRKTSTPPNAVSCFDTTYVSRQQRLILQYGKNSAPTHSLPELPPSP